MPPCTSINHKNLSRNSGPFIFLEKYFPEAPSVSNLFILTFCGGKVGFNVTVCLCVHFLFLLTVATKVWLLAVNPARRHSRSQMSCRSLNRPRKVRSIGQRTWARKHGILNILDIFRVSGKKVHQWMHHTELSTNCKVSKNHIYL